MKGEEKGGWVEVQGKRGRKYNVVRREDMITVFIATMPVYTRVELLRSAFSQFGRVMDVFIPASGRRSSGARFGFIKRFKEKRIALKAVDAMNGSSLCGRKLTVKLANFGWAKRRTGVKYQGVPYYRVKENGVGCADWKGNTPVVKKSSAFSSMVGDKSFVEVIKVMVVKQENKFQFPEMSLKKTLCGFRIVGRHEMGRSDSKCSSLV